jgi:drug/metabolite transporter (DMT)-like permease
MAVSTVVARKALPGVPTLQATFVRMAAGTAGVLLLGAAAGRLGAWRDSFSLPGVAPRFFGAVCVVTFGGFWLSLVAIRHLEVATANTLIAAEPLFLLPLSAVLLRERPTPRAVAGTVVAAAGIALLCLG